MSGIHLKQLAASGASSNDVAKFNGTNWAAAAGGSSIGDTIGSATAGSLLFAGVAGILAQDNANLFWDDTNNRIGIGTATPSTGLDVAGAGNTAGLQLRAGASTAVSDSSTARLRYNQSTAKLQASLSGGAYADISVGAAGSLNSSTTYTGGGTTNSALFVGPFGFVETSQNEFAWDNTNSRLGLGTSGPTFKLDMSGSYTTELLRLYNTNGAGLSGVHLKGSDGNEKGGFGFGNPTFASTFLQSKNYLRTTGPDWVIANATRAEFELGMTTGSTSLQMQNGSGAAVGAASTGKLIYNTTGQKFQTSSSGGAYVDVGTYAAALTTGSVPFANANNRLAQDNANFFWDDTNDRLGIRTASPTSGLTIASTVAGETSLEITEAVAGTVSMMSLARSTVGASGNMLQLTRAPTSGSTGGNGLNINWGNGGGTNTGTAVNVSFQGDSSGHAFSVTHSSTGGGSPLNISKTGAASGAGIALSMGASTVGTGVSASHAGTGTVYQGTHTAGGTVFNATLSTNTGGRAFGALDNTAGTNTLMQLDRSAASATGVILAINKAPTSGSTGGNGININWGTGAGTVSGSAVSVTNSSTGRAYESISSSTGVSLRASGTGAAVEMANSTPAVSAASEGRLKYDSGSQTFAASANGVAYQSIDTMAQVALTDAANIATNAALGKTFTVTLAGNRTLDNPTNLLSGRRYVWVVTQDGTGTRTLAYGALFKWPGGVAPVLTLTAGAVDKIEAVYDGTSLLALFTLNHS